MNDSGNPLVLSESEEYSNTLICVADKFEDTTHVVVLIYEGMMSRDYVNDNKWDC